MRPGANTKTRRREDPIDLTGVDAPERNDTSDWKHPDTLFIFANPLRISASSCSTVGPASGRRREQEAAHSPLEAPIASDLPGIVDVGGFEQLPAGARRHELIQVLQRAV